MNIAFSELKTNEQKVFVNTRVWVENDKNDNNKLKYFCNIWVDNQPHTKDGYRWSAVTKKLINHNGKMVNSITIIAETSQELNEKIQKTLENIQMNLYETTILVENAKQFNQKYEVTVKDIKKI